MYIICSLVTKPRAMDATCKLELWSLCPSEARGVVIGGSEYVKSCGMSCIDSEMAGPITMKLSGIDRGNSVTVLGQRN